MNRGFSGDSLFITMLKRSGIYSGIKGIHMMVDMSNHWLLDEKRIMLKQNISLCSKLYLSITHTLLKARFSTEPEIINFKKKIE